MIIIVPLENTNQTNVPLPSGSNSFQDPESFLILYRLYEYSKMNRVEIVIIVLIFFSFTFKKDWWFDALEFLNLFLVEIRYPMKWTRRSIGQRWCHRRSCLFQRQTLRTQHLHIFHYDQPCLYVGLQRKRWFRFHWRLRISLRTFLILIWWCKYTNYKFKKKYFWK